MKEQVVKYGLTADGAEQYHARKIKDARQRKRDEERQAQLTLEIATYLPAALAEVSSEH